MAFEKISENLHELNNNIKAFTESSAEYFKLELFSKGMKGATSLVNGLVMGLLFLFFLVFISFAFSFWIGEAIGTFSSGFFIVSGFYLLVLLFMKFIGGSLIQKKMLIIFSRKFFNEKEEERYNEDKEDETI